VRLTDDPGSERAPVWSPDGRKIAFVSEGDVADLWDDEIYVMDADGKNQIRSTKNNDEDTSPTWSPDGTKMAFSSDRENHNPVGNKSLWDVYVMNADGSDQRNVTKSPETSQKPWCWTSDGKIIYGIGSSPWIIDADGNNKQMIRDGGLIDIDWFGPSPVLSVKPVDKLISTWGWLKKAFE
jgi:Tol biopolymer transport system component